MSGSQKLTKSQIAQDWVKNHSQSSGADRLVLLIFASYVNNSTGETYPTVDPTVMRETGMKRSAVFRSIRKLDDLGELKHVRKRYNGSSIYEIVGPMYGTSLPEVRPTNGTKVSEVRPISGEVRPTNGTVALKSSKKAAAAKGKKLKDAQRVVGRRQLDAQNRDGGDGLAFTIGRDDFGEAINELIELHPDWTADEIGNAVAVESVPEPYAEPASMGASKDPGVMYCHDHRCYLSECPPSSGHRAVRTKIGELDDPYIYGGQEFQHWRPWDSDLDRGATYTEHDGSVWEICACNNGNGSDCAECGNSGSILVGAPSAMESRP